MVNGKFTKLLGEEFYVIENFDEMQPFFISLASDTDLWMYVSSTGGLSCGRRSPDTALFPYYTDDKITENFDHTGPKTIVRVQSEDSGIKIWEPFSERFCEQYELKRSIAKNVVGNKLLFTEENKTLGLCFSYLWCSADKYGWIRKSFLTSAKDQEVELLDGLQNVLPAGVNRLTQNTYSTLVDGYKKTELVAGSNLVLFRMEAIMVDRAEPSESLRCNTIYGLGLPEAQYLTSSRQLRAFRKGGEVEAEPEARGIRGAIFVHAKLNLRKDETRTWYLVADVEKDAVDVKQLLNESVTLITPELLEEAVSESTNTLREIVAQNDGVQLTADPAVNARHFANVLFNTMRGGFYCNNYTIDIQAFQKHVENFNKALAEECKTFFAGLPAQLQREELEASIKSCGINGQEQLKRLFQEYLPLTFSRRHGDPSRPWNLFNIRVNDEQGNRLISYQGNWRDIFQNWEALSMSYPNYINGIIAKFLNATTVDGYNPYKVTSEGIDWEVIVPEDPWSNIGYWGDHQIIYLQKLLELSYSHNPEAFLHLLDKREYAFANVPYRLKNYLEIVNNPKDSIYFEDELHRHINTILPRYGQDARLVLDESTQMPRLVTFTEKILVTLLAKLSNFIPGAGIWMNTLRPEWNDANNALVGYGSSMVTLCYMRRFVHFLRDIYALDLNAEYELSQELMDFFMDAIHALLGNQQSLENGFDDAARRKFTDAMGLAGEHYRERVYKGHSGEKTQLSGELLIAFFDQTLDYIDDSIRRNKREDGLYNAYNLISFTADGIKAENLYQMLEGQVAALTSGLLSAEESVQLLNAMRQSDIYRADQQSYMLYPFRRRKDFLEVNCVPAEVKGWADYDELLQRGIFREDQEGQVHFNSDFRNAACIPDDVNPKVFDIYEQVFDHHAFTGRSGTFYKYEGLGCIYWHMVSKLLLAVGETIESNQDCPASVQEELKAHYYAIQNGLGAHKQPAAYGSFPFDPYSHTPSMAGVQQPGMTGQVKEDILNRWFELGLHVEDGAIEIRTNMLRKEEFVDGHLRFSYCGTIFDYELADSMSPTMIEREIAQHIFARDGKVTNLTVKIKL